MQKVAGTGTEQTRFRSGKQGIESVCDAKYDAISASRIELLTRGVILVACLNLAEGARAAVLARVVVDLTSPTTRIPESSSKAGGTTQPPAPARDTPARPENTYTPGPRHGTRGRTPWD